MSKIESTLFRFIFNVFSQLHVNMVCPKDANVQGGI